MAMSWCVGVCGVSLHALIHTQTSTHTHMSECEYVLCKLPEWTSDVCIQVLQYTVRAIEWEPHYSGGVLTVLMQQYTLATIGVVHMCCGAVNVPFVHW